MKPPIRTASKLEHRLRHQLRLARIKIALGAAVFVLASASALVLNLR